MKVHGTEIMFVLHLKNITMNTLKHFKMKTLIGLFAVGLLITGCSKNEGCMDITATNYDSSAEHDNGSCVYDMITVETTNAESPVQSDCNAEFIGKWKFLYQTVDYYILPEDSLITSDTASSEMLKGDIEFFHDGSFDEEGLLGTWSLSPGCKKLTDGYDDYNYKVVWDVSVLNSTKLELTQRYDDENYYMAVKNSYERIN